MELQQTMFDYESLEIETGEFVKGKELSIKARTSQTIWENGRDLLEVKERLEHGQFMEWCGANFPWGKSTIQRMMEVADKLPKLGNSDISKSALYLLAQNSTPESARAEAIEKAESGETVTHKDAKELVQAHKTISNLEKQITDLQSTLPTDDVKAKIISLKQQLVDAQNKPVEKVEVPPPDYDQLKVDLETAQRRARNLEESLIEEQKKPPQLVERIVKVRDEDTIKKIEREKKTYREKAAAMSDELAHYERKIRNLESQIEVDNPVNIDMATAKIVKTHGRLLEVNVCEPIKDAMQRSMMLDETKSELSNLVDTLVELQDSINSQSVIDI